MLLGTLRHILWLPSYSLAACCAHDAFLVLFIFYSATPRPLHLGSFKITLAFLWVSPLLSYMLGIVVTKTVRDPNLVVWHAVWNLSATVLRLCVWLRLCALTFAVSVSCCSFWPLSGTFQLKGSFRAARWKTPSFLGLWPMRLTSP